MGLGKQAKVLSKSQVQAMLLHLNSKRNAQRYVVIFLLSVKAGLRAKEIAALTWNSVLNSHGEIGDSMVVTDNQSKAKSGGRTIWLNKALRNGLVDLRTVLVAGRLGHSEFDPIVQSERGHTRQMSAQSIVNKFFHWYAEMGFVGCSSHSGRRTFITNGAKEIAKVGGSLRDIQELAGHSSLAMTQRYIEGSSMAKKLVVDKI